MCEVFMYYYPRIPNLSGCSTQISPKATIDFYRSLMKYLINLNLLLNYPLKRLS